MSRVSVLSVILAHSQTAASPVTSDPSCHDGVREEHAVVVMTGIEDVEVEREDVEEEGKPTEEGGKLINVITEITLISPLLFTLRQRKTCFFLLLHYATRIVCKLLFTLFFQKHGRFQFSWWKKEERWQRRSGFPRPQPRSQEAEQGSSFPQAASLRAADPLHQRARLT